MWLFINHWTNANVYTQHRFIYNKIWISFWCFFFFFCRKFLTPSDKENIFTLDHYPVWYRRAAENPAGSFLYYVPTEDNTQGSPHPAVHIKRLYWMYCAQYLFFFPCSGWKGCDCRHVCYSHCKQKDSTCWRYDLPWLFLSLNLFY